MEIYPGSDKTSIMMVLSHKPGALYKVLARIYSLGINVTKLESRPIPGRSWEYRFFVDFTGDLAAYGMDSILREMSQCAETLRILGNYRADDTE